MADFIGATFDSREVTPGMLFVALKGENADGHDFIESALKKGAVGIVDGIDELTSIASQYRNELKAKVIAVTGSAGKTTTKELLKAFLSTVGKVHATNGNFNNHIGLPITILNCPKDADYLVLEMGSNHPGEIAHLCSIAKPDAGVITNIGTAHLEFFGDKSGIAREKSALFSSLSDSATAIVADNVDELDLIRKLNEEMETSVNVIEYHFVFSCFCRNVWTTINPNPVRECFYTPVCIPGACNLELNARSCFQLEVTFFRVNPDMVVSGNIFWCLIC